jgi:hypothetical protein
MKILADILAEFRGMFLSDLTFSVAILCLVGIVALLAAANPLIAGATLLFGCLALLAAACLWASR